MEEHQLTPASMLSEKLVLARLGTVLTFFHSYLSLQIS